MNMNPRLSFGAHREAATELPKDFKILWKFAEARIDDGDSDQQNVVTECEPCQPRASAR